MAARQPVRPVILGAEGEAGINVPKVGGADTRGVGVDGGVLRVVTVEYLLLGTFLPLALIAGVASSPRCGSRPPPTGGAHTTPNST